MLRHDSSKKKASSSPPAAIRWRSLIASLLVECMATLAITLITLLCWTTSTTDPLQYMPSVTLGLVLICIKDEDYFFPDVLGPSLTFVLWIFGGYSWAQVWARVLGQTLGTVIALYICMNSHVPSLFYREPHTPSVTFAMEAFGTALEHMAVVYVILPLLPPSVGAVSGEGGEAGGGPMRGAASTKGSFNNQHQPNGNNNNNSNIIAFYKGGAPNVQSYPYGQQQQQARSFQASFPFASGTNNYPASYDEEAVQERTATAPKQTQKNMIVSSPLDVFAMPANASTSLIAPKIRPKSDPDAHPPSNQTVMHAAISLAGLHWCLTRGLCLELNPPITLLVGILRMHGHDFDGQANYVWTAATVAIWGQAVGVGICVAYVALFAPRKTKFWPGVLR